MTAQSPWSVKGIDPKARSIARERAHSRGVTLGQYLNSLLLDPDAPEQDRQIREVEIEDVAPRSGNEGELRRMSAEIDMLSERLEASQTRSARAVSGLDKSILSLMGKVEASGKAQLGALERVMRAMSEIEATQGALRSRIDTVESTKGGGATLEALKALESSLGRLAENVQDRLHAVEASNGEFRAKVEDRVSRVDSRFDTVEQQITGIEKRMEGALNRITEAASRFDQLDSKAERAANEASERIERSLQAHLNRSREMSQDLLNRVDGIEGKTRDSITSLSDAVARITDRIAKAERKGDTTNQLLQQSINDIDQRVTLLANRNNDEDFARFQAQFQKRLDSLAEDISRPIHTLRADVERRLEEALKTNNPEKIDRLEHALRHVQEQIRVSEARQADLVETMSAQVERLSRAVDERLRAVEARGDQRSIEDVRREMLKLADVIDARFGQTEAASRAATGAVETLRSDIGRLNTVVDDRMQAFEQRNGAAVEAIANQVTVVADRLQRRHDETIQRLSDRIAETSQQGRFDPAEMDKFAERLDERVKESERRSAEALGQIGEQVARVADRLTNQNQDMMRAFESRLADSGRTHEARLSEVLSDMTRRMDEIGEQSAAALAPVHKTVSSIARRLETLEDGSRPVNAAAAPAVSRDIPAVTDEFVFLKDHSEASAIAPPAAAFAATDLADASGIAGVDPPPFDRGRDAELFEEQKQAGEDGPVAEPASRIDDLLETDDVLLADAPATHAGHPIDPLLDNLDAGPSGPGYIERARRAARENRHANASVGAGRKGIGKGPLIASAALAVAVGGGIAWNVMRGKQEPQGDDFAKLDPSAPVAGQGNADAGASMLFGDVSAKGEAQPAASTHREPAAGDLFDEPAKAGLAAAPTAAAAKAAAETPVMTLSTAVQQGDPIALHDYALELLQSGEKAKGVGMMKEAARRGLVMAEYRLAKLYEKGEGVPRDIAASRSWTEKAAIGGNVKAMHDLAVFYAEGDAGPQSYAAAVEWFRQASDMGLVDSQYNLAVLYEQGLGVTQDKQEAAYWFEVAGRAGDQDAIRRARALFAETPGPEAELLKRRARAFNPKPSIARANGEFGRRPWDIPTAPQLAETQRLLERLGYSPGAADGKLSQTTQEAIRAFQGDNELPVTGEASVTLLRQLRTAVNTSDN